MDVKKVLVADTTVEFCQALAQALDSGLSLRICHDGLEAEQLLWVYSPDVLVMDLALPGLDGIALLQRIADLPKRPKILLTTRFFSPYIEYAISGFGVDLVLIKPCNVEAVAERIVDLADSWQPPVTPQVRTNVCISSMLMDLDIPSKRRGFTYLEMCIQLYMENPGLPLTKAIYPEVAKQYHTHVDAVERAMRQVIHETWANRDDRVWGLYFRCGRHGAIPRPTNAEFISRLAERQRQSLRERA